MNKTWKIITMEYNDINGFEYVVMACWLYNPGCAGYNILCVLLWLIRVSIIHSCTVLKHQFHCEQCLHCTQRSGPIAWFIFHLPCPWTFTAWSGRTHQTAKTPYPLSRIFSVNHTFCLDCSVFFNREAVSVSSSLYHILINDRYHSSF